MSKTAARTIQVKIRDIGEYCSRRKVYITIPADFDFHSKDDTKPLFDAWNNCRSLPADHPFYDNMVLIKNYIRFQEMVLNSHSGKTSITFVGETSDSFKKIQANLSKTLKGKCELSFEDIWGALQLRQKNPSHSAGGS